MRHPLLSTGLALAVAGAAAAALLLPLEGQAASQTEDAADQGPPPAKVVVREAVMVQMAPQVELPGTVISPHDSRIAAAVQGSVVWIAEVGTDAAEGDVIARVDARDWDLARADAAAEVKRLEARLVFLEREVARLEELAATGNTPRARLDESIANRDATAQELVQARNAVARAEVNIDRTEVRAPFPGRVVERLAQPGEFASPGRDLVRLVDIRRPEVRVQVPVGLAGSLKDGLAVTVRGEEGPVPGQIHTLIPVGDAVSRSLEVRVRPAANGWLVGSAVRVALPDGAAKQVVAVPRDALILRAGAVFVYVIDPDDTARRVSVEPGPSQGALIAVEGALKAGERVVIRGGERLRPGQAVTLSDLPPGAQG